jgi:hypothetical protein
MIDEFLHMLLLIPRKATKIYNLGVCILKELVDLDFVLLSGIDFSHIL